LTLLLSAARLTRGAFTLDASFEAPLTGITAVFGPSGAGKSLLLSTIAGLEQLESGSTSLAGASLDATPPHQRDIGVVFQEARLFPHLSVGGNLRYAAKRAPHPGDINAIAEKLEIATLLERGVRDLSGGEKSRVALARALIARPKLLLLDEPFAALDGRRRRAFLALLRDISEAQRLPMIVVTHQIEDAAELADHVVAMKDGRVIAHGSATATMRDSSFLSLLDARDIGVRLSAAAIASSSAHARGVWVRADNVMIAAERPHGLSARNIWEGNVAGIRQESDGSILVSMDTRAGYILSRITPEAATELTLEEGKQVWAVVKAHAL
jgi:molybdate transport system ATP-binding protein